MSGIIFRLYENLGLDQDDPMRFRLEIMVHRGAVVENQDQPVEEHTIPIDQEKYIDINKQLTLRDVDEFFKSLLEFKHSDHSDSPRKGADEKEGQQEKSSPEQGP